MAFLMDCFQEECWKLVLTGHQREKYLGVHLCCSESLVTGPLPPADRAGAGAKGTSPREIRKTFHKHKGWGGNT